MEIKRNDIGVAPGLTLASVPLMLNAYRHGLFELGNLFQRASFLDKIENHNYAVFHKDDYSGREVVIMQLTQKGATFIQNNFLDMLVNLSPYYLFPVIQKGDKVRLTDDLKNEYDTKTGILKKRVISGPSGSSELERGVYAVQSCDNTSIIVTDDCFVPYRLRLADVREKLRLSSDELQSESEELKRRFGLIRVPALVGRLQEKIGTIKLAELVDELYSMPHTKDRIANG